MAENTVQLRRFPCPYRAMLAICSDLDETPDRHVYWEIMRFLNTTKTTRMGTGVGLEVGNSIYFDMPPDQFSYWNTDDAGREMVRSLIRSGHIDCLHSYGDMATTREHAGRALDELARRDCRMDVWIDHGTAVTNFGAEIMRGQGDVPTSPAYHADLTTGYGIRYVWRGRVTSVIGQDVRASLGGLWRAIHPVASTRTVVKETAKRFLGRTGNAKYAMHAPNRVLRRSALRDGTGVYEFIRANPHWGGVSSCETGREIAEVLTGPMLERLIEREGVCVLYTHLGKIDDRGVPLNKSAVESFQRLARAYGEGRVLVTTTRRLLRYLTLRDHLTWSIRREGELSVIDARFDQRNGFAQSAFSREDWAGLTFYVPDASRWRVRANGTMVEGLRVNPPDRSGRHSVSIPWRSLEFPD